MLQALSISHPTTAQEIITGEETAFQAAPPLFNQGPERLSKLTKVIQLVNWLGQDLKTCLSLQSFFFSPGFLCRILFCFSPSKHTILGERPGSRDYDLIMTKWEAEGVGRGQEESVVVLRHKQGVVGLLRAKEHATLEAPGPSPKLSGTTKSCNLRLDGLQS